VARISTGIWDDPSFRDLSEGAQLLYLVALTIRAHGPITPARVARKTGWSRETTDRMWESLLDTPWGDVLDGSIKRKRMPAWLRAEVYRRDGCQCLICGTSKRLTVDHVYPVSRGGGDEIENLQTLCHSCNSKKGARLNGP
jgi:hypothetical protein